MKHYVKIEGGEVVNRTIFTETMPEGRARPGDEWVEHEDAQIGWLVDGSELVPPPPPPAPPPIPDDVIAERERRLSLGFDYDFGDARGVHRIGTTPADMRKWMDEVTPFAQAFVNAGQSSGENGITTDTGPATVTAAEWQAILLAAGAYRQPIYQASSALQAMDHMPVDLTEDSYWPSVAGG